jgi:hypothetical protein
MTKRKALPYHATGHRDAALMELSLALGAIKVIVSQGVSREELYRLLAQVTDHMHRAMIQINQINIEKPHIENPHIEKPYE